MKIEVKENRNIKPSGIAGTMNENNVTEIEINVPEKYKDYNKKIVFTTDDGTVWDIIQDNIYIIKKNISKYRDVSFYIWLTKDEDDFRSKTYPLNFNENQDASDEITDEEMGRVNTVIDLLEEEITKVTDLEKEVQDLIEDIQFKLDNGEFKGDKGDTYTITPDDYRTIEINVKTDIQPILKEIEDVAKQSEIIAKGRATGYVFDTVEELDNWLLVEENVSKLVLGDNLYIRTVGVPDYWWDGTEKQVLETEKPDLTAYAKTEQFVTLTQAEYDALTEKSANTYYFIIEEE